MFTRRRLTLAAVWACLLAPGALAPAFAASRENCVRQFQPQTGQAGKDVIWVPTSDALVTRMLQMADVTARDRVYDLGSGDGKIPLAAARQFGATAVGVEYDAQLARLAQCYVEAAGLDTRVRVIQGDIFEIDFSSATVVTLYLLPELNLRLRPTILAMTAGTRVVSHSFLMGEWQPDERSKVGDEHAYLWIVPADVAGTWRFQQPGSDQHLLVRLEQRFQQIDGSVGEPRQPLVSAQLRGVHLQLGFRQDGAIVELTGTVDGERIEARVTRGGATASYLGTRIRADH